MMINIVGLLLYLLFKDFFLFLRFPIFFFFCFLSGERNGVVHFLDLNFPIS